MRKLSPYAAALAVLAACALAGCSPGSNTSHAGRGTSNTATAAPADNTSGDTGSPIGATANTSGSSNGNSSGNSNNNGNSNGSSNGGGGTGTATGLLAYAPSGLRSSCSDTGTSGHLPASVTGYTDSLSCNLGGSTPAEVDYYQYASTGDMQAAYSSASADDSFDAPQQPGGCTGGSNEYGTWSIGGSAIGDIACPINNLNGVNLIWDDSNTNIIAVVNADHWLPTDTYSWWQSNGASIDGSAQGASSS